MSLIVWFLPFYLPAHEAGTELSAHAVNRFLIGRGHQVAVCSARPRRASFEGVQFVDLFSAADRKRVLNRAGVLFNAYYPDYADLALRYSTGMRIPLVHIVDSPLFRDRFVALQDVPGQHVVYASEWARDRMGVQLPSVVVHPPVDWRDYQVLTNRRCITLINVNENKGGRLFIELARRMPHKAFLGVLGAYGEMVVESGVPNLTYVPQRQDVREIYAQTGMLLMPSQRESWGRTGVEAMASGIPVIANPTPGLMESLSYAGLFCDRDAPDEWVRTIEALDDPAFYGDVSARCVRRARELDPAEDLERFVAFVDDIIKGQSV